MEYGSELMGTFYLLEVLLLLAACCIICLSLNTLLIVLICYCCLALTVVNFIDLYNMYSIWFNYFVIYFIYFKVGYHPLYKNLWLTKIEILRKDYSKQIKGIYRSQTHLFLSLWHGTSSNINSMGMLPKSHSLASLS